MARHTFRTALLVGLVALYAAAPGALAAEQVAWNGSEQLSAELPTSWFPEIVADQTGTVWAVWETTRDATEPNVTGENGAAVMLARLDEQGWSEPANILVKDIYNAGRPVLMSDGLYMHMLVRTVAKGESTQLQARMFHLLAPLTADLLDARSWSQPQTLSNSASYWGQLVALPDGALVATYNQITDVIIDGEPDARTVLYSRRSTDHGINWTPPVRVSQSEQRVGRNSLVALADGTLVVAWDEGYDNLTGLGEPLGSAMAFSTDGGLSWEGHTTFRRHTEQVSLATDGARLLLLYRSTIDDFLYFRESLDQGRSWLDEQAAPGVTLEPYPGKHNFHKLGVATDSAGATTVAYVGPWEAANEGLAVLTTTYVDGEWSEPVLAALTSGFPEYPRLAVALGNQLQLVFFSREERFVDTGRNSIWAAAGGTSAPALEAVALVAAPETESGVTGPAADVIAPVMFPTAIPEPVLPAGGFEASDSPQAALNRPVLWVLALTAGAMLTILAMRALWRSLLNARI